MTASTFDDDSTCSLIIDLYRSSCILLCSSQQPSHWHAPSIHISNRKLNIPWQKTQERFCLRSLTRKEVWTMLQNTALDPLHVWLMVGSRQSTVCFVMTNYLNGTKKYSMRKKHRMTGTYCYHRTICKRNGMCQKPDMHPRLQCLRTYQYIHQMAIRNAVPVTLTVSRSPPKVSISLVVFPDQILYFSKPTSVVGL